jgi:hypothetical protein
MKRTIAKECPGKDSNERELYHGTSGDAIEGIINQRYLEGAPSPSHPFDILQLFVKIRLHFSPIISFVCRRTFSYQNHIYLDLHVIISFFFSVFYLYDFKCFKEEEEEKKRMN